MHKIDNSHLNCPFARSRMLRDLLGLRGLEVGRRHIRTLMRRMGIESIYRRLNTSKPSHDIGFTLTCCATWPSRVPTKSGPWRSLCFSIVQAWSIWLRWRLVQSPQAGLTADDHQGQGDFLLRRGARIRHFPERKSRKSLISTGNLLK